MGTFSRPTTVITQASIVPASFEYHFSSPTAISHQQKAGSVTNSPLPRTPRTVSTQGDRRLAVAQKHHPVASPPKMMFSAMPDVTNNLVRKPHSSDTGAASMQRLPDLGLGPASHLKTGSVMDILGKKSWVADLWCLSINYEMVLSRKRWFPLHLNQWLVNAVEESSQLQNLSYIRDQGRFSVTNQELKTFLHGATEKGILRPNSSQN